MTLSVGVCMGKMLTLYEGLGEYGMLFGEHLARRAPALWAEHGIRLWYRVPAPLRGAFGHDVGYLTQLALQRHFSMHLRRFDLWHVLHQHNPYRRPLGSRRCLVTVHDLNHRYGTDTRFQTKAKRRLARLAAGADEFVAISEHTQRDLVQEVGGTKPVTVIHNGVRDLTAIEPQRPSALPAGWESSDGAGYFFHLSRMAPLKNVDSLLALMQRMPAHRLVLCGPRSRESERVQAQSRGQGLNNVVVLFDVSVAEKAWLFRHCRAFMFPSLAEGFGLPPIEAMQFGKPVFLSDRTSLPEIGGDVASYWSDFNADAMRQVVLDRLARRDADPAGDERRTRARAERFSWDRCIDEHVIVYLRVLRRAAEASGRSLGGGQAL